MDELYPAVFDSEISSYETLGGLKLVSGWNLVSPGDFREFVDAGLNPDTDVHESFDSLQDVVNFMSGTGEYQDRNSFFVDERDGVMQQSEGFFSPMYCEGCVTELIADTEVGDEQIDPEIRPSIDEYKADSFRPGYEKFVEEIDYKCVDHPESQLSMRRTNYEEQ